MIKGEEVKNALLPSWEVKSNTLKELNDKKEIKLVGLIANLIIHEMKRKVREEKSPQKKKILSFKFTPSIFDEEDVLAQRPITLVLMMINSCSYNINDLVFT